MTSITDTPPRRVLGSWADDDDDDDWDFDDWKATVGKNLEGGATVEEPDPRQDSKQQAESPAAESSADDSPEVHSDCPREDAEKMRQEMLSSYPSFEGMRDWNTPENTSGASDIPIEHLNHEQDRAKAPVCYGANKNGSEVLPGQVYDSANNVCQYVNDNDSVFPNGNIDREESAPSVYGSRLPGDKTLYLSSKPEDWPQEGVNMKITVPWRSVLDMDTLPAYPELNDPYASTRYKYAANFKQAKFNKHGRLDALDTEVYSRCFLRIQLDYCDAFTPILEKGDELVGVKDITGTEIPAFDDAVDDVVDTEDFYGGSAVSVTSDNIEKAAFISVIQAASRTTSVVVLEDDIATRYAADDFVDEEDFYGEEPILLTCSESGERNGIPKTPDVDNILSAPTELVPALDLATHHPSVVKTLIPGLSLIYPSHVETEDASPKSATGLQASSKTEVECGPAVQKGDTTEIVSGSWDEHVLSNGENNANSETFEPITITKEILEILFGTSESAEQKKSNVSVEEIVAAFEETDHIEAQEQAISSQNKPEADIGTINEASSPSEAAQSAQANGGWMLSSLFLPSASTAIKIGVAATAIAIGAAALFRRRR